MPENYTKPWLANLFSSPKLEIDETREHIGRAVQLIRIQNEADTHPELKYPVTCEISDGKHYMQAVLARSSIKRLRKASNRHIESLCGALVTIHSCVPKLFVPGVTHTNCVPRNIASSNSAGFWMVITKVRYVGGAGNGIDGDLSHISSSAYVRHRLSEYVEDATPCGDSDVAQGQIDEGVGIEDNECQEEGQADHRQEAGDDQISDDDNGDDIEPDERTRVHDDVIEPEEVEMDEPVLKRQRVDAESESLLSVDISDAMEMADLFSPGLNASQNEGQNEDQNAGQNAGQNRGQANPQAEALAPPILPNQPICFTADAAWECQEMWYALSVQQAALPLMRMNIPEQQHITSGRAASDSRRQPAAAAYARNNGHCMPRSTLAETSDNRGGSIANTVTAGPRVHQPLPETIVNRPAPDRTPGAPDLDRLMRPEGYGCVDSNVAMDSVFGPIQSSPPCSTGVDIQDGSMSAHIEYNQDITMMWNQPDQITLCEISPAGEAGQRI